MLLQPLDSLLDRSCMAYEDRLPGGNRAESSHLNQRMMQGLESERGVDRRVQCRRSRDRSDAPAIGGVRGLFLHHFHGHSCERYSGHKVVLFGHRASARNVGRHLGGGRRIVGLLSLRTLQKPPHDLIYIRHACRGKLRADVLDFRQGQVGEHFAKGWQLSVECAHVRFQRFALRSPWSHRRARHASGVGQGAVVRASRRASRRGGAMRPQAVSPACAVVPAQGLDGEVRYEPRVVQRSARHWAFG
mmetsp:Transcript_91039/g.257208  ORF Transcript_91039/g.257208 Transcript_91039/m.257208 type:complete len:246 (-) Transcript_91039:133-870(-)